MLFSKPSNIKYTEMAKEFDEEFYTDHRDDAKLFKYLYLIFYMLACRSNYFNNNFEDLDKYSQYAATKIYTRYLKRWQHGEKFKSILNYAKTCKDHLKVDYQNESFAQVTQKDDEDVKVFEQIYKNSIRESFNREELVYDIQEILKTVPKATNAVLRETPYTKNALMYKRLYMSCILTFLSNITLPNAVLESKRGNKEGYTFKFYQRGLYGASILWNLDDSLSDYVQMLVNKIRMKMGSEINDLAADYRIPEEVVESIIASAYDEKKPFEYDGTLD